ncbi:uncharacterized protein LOC101850037 [Aplysia californica]|uniref:Uncharacterized protein LOC101850037 n=1 Tax=Aplysia californica TaxID=6500 RepID=A0ABM0K5N4_APLCA|nr:uncharacterized protein LOC101850037 [Aplysia californica]
MNEVDFLLVNDFSSLKLRDQMRVKELGPHQPKDIKIVQPTKVCNRVFNPNLFETVEWLTVSVSKHSLHCFYCLLFGTDDAKWSKNGFKDLVHVKQSIGTHGSSKAHVNNAVKYHTFGLDLDLDREDTAAQFNLGHRITTMSYHNERVRKNRHVLCNVIECILFCGTHGLDLYGHEEGDLSGNRGIFLDLLHRDANTDRILSDHLQSATVATYTSKIIQNELLDCIFKIYHEELNKDIHSAKFLSVQVDEATDVGHFSQFAIILRYIKDGKPVERFLKFFEAEDRTQSGLVSTLREALEPFSVEEKLIAQTYDGAAVMSGRVSGVQAQMRQFFPNAVLVHCHAHPLTFVLKQACSGISDCRIFFANAAGFSAFFAHSTERMDVLRRFCDRNISRLSETRRNYQSLPIKTVFTCKGEIQLCLQEILSEHWDDDTTREACGLLNVLKSDTFLFFLDFFNKMFSHVDVLQVILQHGSTTPLEAQQALDAFKTAVEEIGNSISVPSTSQTTEEQATKRRRHDNTREIAAKEACDIIVHQIVDRFSEQNKISTLSIVDPSRFQDYQTWFPSALWDSISNTESYSVLPKMKLQTELEILYSNETFKSAQCGTMQGLYSTLRDYKLDTTFTRVCRILEIALTTPIASVETEQSSSTLNRIKAFSRSKIGRERLDVLAFMSVHKDVIDNIPNFVNRIMDAFAETEERRADFLFE